MAKHKHHRKTKKDLHVRSSDSTEPAQVDFQTAIQQVFEGLYSDLIAELVTTSCLVDGNGEEVEGPALVARVDPSGFVKIVASYWKRDGGWGAVKVPLNGGGDAELVWDRLAGAASKQRVVQMLDALAMSAQLLDGIGLQSFESSLSGDPDPGEQRRSSLDEEIKSMLPPLPLGEQIKSMLPPSLQSPLFLDIVGQVGNELSKDGMMDELNALFFAQGGSAQEVQVNADMLPDDPDLPPMSEELKQKLEAEDNAKRSKSKKLDPAALINLSKTLMGGEGAGENGALGGDLVARLRGLAEKVSEDVKTRVSCQKVSKEEIRATLTNALGFLSELGTGGGNVPGQPAIVPSELD
jgi:hypothetical protein